MFESNSFSTDSFSDGSWDFGAVVAAIVDTILYPKRKLRPRWWWRR